MLPQMKINEAFAFMADFYKSWNPQRAEELRQFLNLIRMNVLLTYRKEIQQK